MCCVVASKPVFAHIKCQTHALFCNILPQILHAELDDLIPVFSAKCFVLMMWLFRWVFAIFLKFAKQWLGKFGTHLLNIWFASSYRVAFLYLCQKHRNGNILCSNMQHEHLFSRQRCALLFIDRVQSASS